MKTAEEILKEHGILMVDFISSSAHGAVLKAMKAYAELAIDEAANRATTKNKTVAGRGYNYQVDRESILKVKSQLK